jgi:hypothetical protein
MEQKQSVTAREMERGFRGVTGRRNQEQKEGNGRNGATTFNQDQTLSQRLYDGLGVSYSLLAQAAPAVIHTRTFGF